MLALESGFPLLATKENSAPFICGRSCSHCITHRTADVRLPRDECKLWVSSDLLTHGDWQSEQENATQKQPGTSEEACAWGRWLPLLPRHGELCFDS